MPTIFAIIVGILLNEFARSAIIAFKKTRRPMYYYVIERMCEATGQWDASYHRPFKAKTAEKANAMFENAVPRELWDTHRFRRVEHGEFIIQGGL